MSDPGTPSLAEDLTVEFGDVLPPTLIERTVDAAATRPGGPEVVELTAREDLTALADAVARSTSGHDEH